MAEHAHTSKSNISNLENGNQGYSAAILGYLAQAFGCSVSQIFLLAEHLNREALADGAKSTMDEIPIELLLMQLPSDVQQNVRALIENLLRASQD